MVETPPFVLPPENTDEGAMARLFINEAAGPHGSAALTVQAMGWMKRVLVNRLEHPGQFDAPGATRLTQVIQAHNHAVQFTGFTDYPTIGAGVMSNIQSKLDIASDPGDPRHASYLAFVQAAITAARMPAPPDPCPTGLYFWKTTGTVSPGGKATFYRSLDGNDFYTLPIGFFGSPRPAHQSAHRATHHAVSRGHAGGRKR